MRPLKVFSYTLSCYSSDPVKDFYPDADNCRQLRAIVATTTQKAARDLFGITQTEFRDYGGETGNDREIEVAMAKPGQVFARPINAWDGPFFEVSRKPHVPVKRLPARKPFSFTSLAEQPRFSREELEAIMERFAMSNDEVGQGIAAKASKMLGN